MTEPGRESPYRNRSPEESLDLFRRMREGEFAEGAHVLRARIDMASPNMLMRDPVLYRIRRAHHYRTGDAWCIYPLYDFAHCLEDAFEGVTHSLCTLEFENNRELYDWVLDGLDYDPWTRPHQYEFARLDLEHAVLSKRRIAPLVRAGAVSGWDDPRLSTVAGIRRRGVPPEAVRLFCEMIGVARTNSTVDAAKLDWAIRETLNPVAPRVLAVLDPIRVVLVDFPEDRVEEIDAPWFPHDVPGEGTRTVPFARELLIERADFEESPPKGFRRLVPGGRVRLRHAYVIRCEEVVKDAAGRVVELRCTHEADSLGAGGRGVKGTIQWVSERHALPAEIRLYGPLFRDAEADRHTAGDEEPDVLGLVDPDSLVTVPDARVEPSVARDPVGTRYQFERIGYFWRDPVDGTGERPVFNRIVPLKDSWARGESRRAGDTAVPDTRPGRDGTLAPGTPPRLGEERVRRRSEDPGLQARFERFRDGLGLPREQADLLTASPEVADFYEAALGVHPRPADVAAWIVTDLRGLRGERALEELPFEGAALGRLAALVDEGRVSRRAAKEVLAHMVERGGEPDALVEELGLAQLGDEDALARLVDDVLAQWPEKVEEYRAGNRNLIGLFVGQAMKASGGAADPRITKSLLLERLDDVR